MMIKILERLFRKSMRLFWYKALLSGNAIGIFQVQAIIASELKLLQSGKTLTKANGERVAELNYVMAQSKVLLENIEKAKKVALNENN